MRLVQNCLFPLVLVMLSLIYDPDRQKLNWFGFLPEETEIILSIFEPFRVLVPPMHRLGQVVRDIDLDETEASFLCALFLMDSGK